MELPNIALFVAPDHPTTPVFRQGLRQALLDLNLPIDWSEHYPGQEQLPGYLQNKKAPFLVINERPDSFPADTTLVPWIKERIQQVALSGGMAGKRLQRKRVWKTHLSLLLNLFIAFFPKCPLCWAAYLSLIGLVGAHSIAYRSWFLPLAVLMLMVNLGSLYVQRKGRPLKPFWLSLAGSTMILTNRLYFLSMGMLLAGAGALLLASLWSALPERMELTLKYHIVLLLRKGAATANRLLP